MERIYLDQPTAEMLYAKDEYPVTCHERHFEFDEVGRLHLLYFSDKGKVLRDFLIPSDPEPTATQLMVKDSMAERIERQKRIQRARTIAFGALTVCLVSIAVSVLYIITNL